MIVEVKERKEERYYAVCDYCECSVYPSHYDISVFYGFKSANNTFACMDCKTEEHNIKVLVPWKKIPCFDEPTFADELNGVVTRIDVFGYNIHGVCIENAINIEFDVKSKKVHAEIEIGKAIHGWTYGLMAGSSYSHDGAGSASHGIHIDSPRQYRTKEQAILAATYEVYRILSYEWSKAPTQAKKEINKYLVHIAEKLKQPPPIPIKITDEAKHQFQLL